VIQPTVYIQKQSQANEMMLKTAASKSETKVSQSGERSVL
jgi:hypothetical protein